MKALPTCLICGVQLPENRVFCDHCLMEIKKLAVAVWFATQPDKSKAALSKLMEAIGKEG